MSQVRILTPKNATAATLSTSLLALHVQQSFGTQAAARVMEHRGIGMEVAMRVLATRRRIEAVAAHRARQESNAPRVSAVAA